jgi:hypothetical protein
LTFVRQALHLTASLVIVLALAGAFLFGALMSVHAGMVLAFVTLLLGPPQLAFHCLLFAVRRRAGDPRGITNIALLMSGWAIGGLIAVMIIAAVLLAGTPRESHMDIAMVTIFSGQVLALLWLLKTPGLLDSFEAPFFHPWVKPLLGVLFVFFVGSMILSVVITGPTLAVLMTFDMAFYTGGRLPAALLVLASLPGTFAGAGMLRRGQWMLAVRRVIMNLKASTLRAAAAGPIEVRGRACGIEGVEIPLTSPFDIDDGTARARVETPDGYVPGSDDRTWLRKESGARRQQATAVAAGSSVLVIGEFVPPATIRPWRPPFGRALSRFVDRFVDETLQRDADQSWNQIGFGCPSEVFLVTDLDERRAKEKLTAAWRRILALGLLLVSGSFGLVALAVRSWLAR